jgi:hypothetical protein
MLPSRLACKAMLCSMLIVAPEILHADNYTTNGGEFRITPSLPGDQVHARSSFGANGGYLTWEDNFTDGDGLGVSALRFDRSFSAYLMPIRINANGANDQERVQTAMLKNGGTVFVWQGGRQSFQHIWARFVSPTGTWLTTNDVAVSTDVGHYQSQASIAVLTTSNVIVVWSSRNQASGNSMLDVYGQLLSPAGQKIGGEFLVNQYTSFNQRYPTVAALNNGGFVVAWVSEMQRSGPVDNIDANYSYSTTNGPSVDIICRLYGADGTPAGNEMLVNTGSSICADPVAAGASGGGFMIAWAQKDVLNRTNGWDIYARPFTTSGAATNVLRVNTYTYGDQYQPQIAASISDYMIVWTSLAQDGSREGVFGQFLHWDGTPGGSELRVNTTWIGQQIHPSVSSDGATRFLVTWSGFTGVDTGFDVFAQSYVSTSQPLATPSAPYVTVLGSNALSVSWAPIAGLNVASYEVFADGATSPTAATTNVSWTMSGLSPNSTHYFQLDYVLADTRRSPISAATTNSTYGVYAWGGIPFDWMSYYFGNDISSWPSANADPDGDGATLLQEYLAGTNPTNAASVLRMKLQSTPQGLFLNWNTVPGLIYQVQTSSNLLFWSNLGGPRFAPGNSDSMNVGGSRAASYRVIRQR